MANGREEEKDEDKEEVRLLAGLEKGHTPGEIYEGEREILHSNWVTTTS
jgi:hypothetical protein